MELLSKLPIWSHIHIFYNRQGDVSETGVPDSFITLPTPLVHLLHSFHCFAYATAAPVKWCSTRISSLSLPFTICQQKSNINTKGIFWTYWKIRVQFMILLMVSNSWKNSTHNFFWERPITPSEPCAAQMYQYLKEYRSYPVIFWPYAWTCNVDNVGEHKLLILAIALLPYPVKYKLQLREYEI